MIWIFATSFSDRCAHLLDGRDGTRTQRRVALHRRLRSAQALTSRAQRVLTESSDGQRPAPHPARSRGQIYVHPSGHRSRDAEVRAQPRGACGSRASCSSSSSGRRLDDPADPAALRHPTGSDAEYRHELAAVSAPAGHRHARGRLLHVDCAHSRCDGSTSCSYSRSATATCTCWGDRASHGPWTTQQVRNLIMDPRRTCRPVPVPVPRPRPGRSRRQLDAVMADAGIEVVKIPPQCPRANCFARTPMARRARPTPTRFSSFEAPPGRGHGFSWCAGAGCHRLTAAAVSRS